MGDPRAERRRPSLGEFGGDLIMFNKSKKKELISVRQNPNNVSIEEILNKSNNYKTDRKQTPINELVNQSLHLDNLNDLEQKVLTVS